MATKKAASKALASLAIIPLALGQFIAPPTDLTETEGYYNQTVRYKEVPEGICELTPGVKSYSGYVDVAPEQSVFWWFFEARNGEPEDAPLTVWINGGPGSSSLIGLFEEIGPCWVNEAGELQYREYAWNNVSNVLFVDHPAQVGFSYSDPVPGYVDPNTGDIITLPNATCPEYALEYDTCGTYSSPNVSNTANTTEGAAPSMWKTLQGFMGAFPQYSANGVHFGTESYGGHYGPLFNEYFLKQNALIHDDELPGAKEIDLQSVMIGNGWYDPRIQYEAFYWFAVSPGNTYDYKPFNSSVETVMHNSFYGPGNCLAQSIDCNNSGENAACERADTFCYNNVESLLGRYADRDEYDIRELVPDPFPYGYWSDYVNTAKVQQALGAFVNHSTSSSTVSQAFGNTGDDDRESGTVAASRFLADEGVYTVHFAGDADYVCNWLGVQEVMNDIDAPGYSSAGFVNITTSDKIVHGQVKQSDNVAFVRIYESGHEVPFYQPVVAFEMFERVIQGKDVATGKKRIEQGRGYKTVGTAKSEYREGNSTVQFEVTPAGSTYNTTTDEPDALPGNGTANSKRDLHENNVKKLNRKSHQPITGPIRIPRS